MVFEPKQKNKAPEVAILCFFIAAGVAYAFASLEGVKGRGFLQLMALALFCAMVFVLVRYKMTTVRYTIRVSEMKTKSLHRDDEDESTCAVGITRAEMQSLPIRSLPPESLELIVEKRQGRGVWVMECLLKLSDIESCTILPGEEKLFKEKAKSKGITKYKYFRNMVAPEQMAILSASPAGRIMVFLENERELSEYLRAVAIYNRNKKDGASAN